LANYIKTRKFYYMFWSLRFARQFIFHYCFIIYLDNAHVWSDMHVYLWAVVLVISLCIIIIQINNKTVMENKLSGKSQTSKHIIEFLVLIPSCQHKFNSKKSIHSLLFSWKHIFNSLMRGNAHLVLQKTTFPQKILRNKMSRT
jgi:hypothetical protein